jgi:hypothetical protein
VLLLTYLFSKKLIDCNDFIRDCCLHINFFGPCRPAV